MPTRSEASAATNSGSKPASERDRRPLTDRDIKALRVGEKVYGSLPHLPGSLVARARPSGKSFFYRYRNKINGERYILIGPYDERGGRHGLRLRDATEKAAALAKQLQQTPDLSEHRRLEKLREIDARRAELRERQTLAEHTLGKLCDLYVEHLKQRKRGAHKDVANLFKLHLSAELRAMPAASVTATEITAAVRRLIQPSGSESPKPRTAGKLRSYLSAAFSLALRAESDPTAPAAALGFRLSANPAAAVRAHNGVRARDRVLTDDELRFFMKRAAAVTEAAADALALSILLGGQRPAQLLRATVDDVQGDVLTLRDPKGRRQAPRIHTLPLSEAAKEIVARRVKAAGTFATKSLFSTHGKASLRLETLSEYVKRISDDYGAKLAASVGSNSLSGSGNGKQDEEGSDLEVPNGFQLRDIRRTCETQLAALGVSRDVRAQLLSHGLGGVQQQHYDRHDYMDDKRRALAMWEQRLHDIREGRARVGKVFSLRGAA